MRKVSVMLMLLVAGFGLGACGDDDDGEAAAKPAPDTGTEDATTSDTRKPKSEYCLVAKKLQDGFNPERYAETDKDKVRKTFSDFVKANDKDLTRLVDLAPDEIADGVRAGVEAFRKAADGDIEAIADLEGNAEARKASDYEREHCTE